MLEFFVPAQFEVEAKSILCQKVGGFPVKERPQILEGILNEFKGGEIAPRMSAYSVKYNTDGTTAVTPISMGFGGNEHTLQRFLEDEGQTIMLRKEGKSICIAPFRINDEIYLRTFDPEQAQTIRENLTAQLTAPKEPSFYDKVCDFFATRILKRPGKAVQAYNDQKAFYDTMQKAADNFGGIPEKVEAYRQEKAEEEMRPQREKEEQARLLQQQKEQEETERKLQADLKKQQEQKIKQQREEEDKRFQEQQKEQRRREALTKQQSEEYNTAQIEQLEEMYKNLPKQIRDRDILSNHKNLLNDELQTSEKNFDIVKTKYEKDKNWLAVNKQDLLEANKALSEAREDLKKLDKLKALNEKKAAVTATLKRARKDVEDNKKELEEENIKFKKLEADYDAVKGDQFLFDMTAKQYIHHLHVQNSQKRRHAFERNEHKQLQDKMKDVQSEIENAKIIKEQVDKESDKYDRNWFTGFFTDKGQALTKMDKKIADLEKQYANLKKQEQEQEKAFKEKEKEYQAKEDDFSPENLKKTEDFLKANREKGASLLQACKDSYARQKELTTKIRNGNDLLNEAQQELDVLKKNPLYGYQYNADDHKYLAERVPGLSQQVKELTPKIDKMENDLKKQETLVNNAEFVINQNKVKIAKVDGEYGLAADAVSKTLMAISNTTHLLQLRGVAVPKPPEEIMPHLQKMPLFHPQNQPKPQHQPR